MSDDNGFDLVRRPGGSARSGGAGKACGRIVARRDVHGPLGRAGFAAVVAVAAAFGRLRPAHRATEIGRPVRVVHVPVRVAVVAAAAATALARLSRSGPPVLTRYAVDQLAHGVVLDISRATARATGRGDHSPISWFGSEPVAGGR